MRFVRLIYFYFFAHKYKQIFGKIIISPSTRSLTLPKKNHQEMLILKKQRGSRR